MLSYTKRLYFNYAKSLYQTIGVVNAKSYPGLNGAKGLLILLVVFTHCAPPGMILYFLYFFHMPLFMAISGFLLKESAFQYGYASYMKRMCHRLIIPWVIASIIFLPIKLSDGINMQLHFTDLLYPYYHLWYIPSYLIGASICYTIIKYKVPVLPVLFVFASITIVWYNIYRDTSTPVNELPLYWLGDKRLFSYLFFFITAFGLRNNLLKFSFTPFLLLVIKVIAFASIAFFIFRNFSSLYIVWPYMLFNTCLVLFVLVYVAPQKILQNKLFLWVNEHSIGLYLYHPLFVMLIFILLNDRAQNHVTIPEAFVIFTIAISLTIGLVLLLKKWWLTDKYLLGNIKR